MYVPVPGTKPCPPCSQARVLITKPKWHILVTFFIVLIFLDNNLFQNLREVYFFLLNFRWQAQWWILHTDLIFHSEHWLLSSPVSCENEDKLHNVFYNPCWWIQYKQACWMIFTIVIIVFQMYLYRKTTCFLKWHSSRIYSLEHELQPCTASFPRLLCNNELWQKADFFTMSPDYITSKCQFFLFFFWGGGGGGFSYLMFYVTPGVLSVILWRVGGRAEETSTVGQNSVNCLPTASNYQLSHKRLGQDLKS